MNVPNPMKSGQLCSEMNIHQPGGPTYLPSLASLLALAQVGGGEAEDSSCPLSFGLRSNAELHVHNFQRYNTFILSYKLGTKKPTCTG
jgi:hypothetical protein